MYIPPESKNKFESVNLFNPTIKKIKIKINFNTWLEFPEGTTADEITRRIEKFKFKAGKHHSVGFAAKTKENF